MRIYNVFFKGGELKITPFCNAFRTLQSAEKYCKSEAKKKGLTVISSDCDDEQKYFIDYRAEDKQGNSYYFVIYFQTI